MEKMWTILSLILLTFTTPLEATLKTYCKKSDSKCDTTWTPVDNLEAALVGYDLPSGNPFASNFIEDPGLRKQIFNATVPANEGDDGYRLETGISVREYDMCDDKFKTKLATSLSSYKKIAMSNSLAGFGYDIGIEAEDGEHEGALPSLVTIAWEHTDDVKNLASFFTLTKGAVAVSEAQCITHKVDVSHFLTPSFHPSFVGVLKILEQQETEVKQERAFKKFVRDYGTHYLSSAFLGAKLSALTHYTSYEKLKLGKQNLLECSSMQAFNQFKLENEHIEDKEDELKKLLNLTQCWSDGDGDHFNGKSRTKMVNYGTKPGNNKLSKWIDEDIRPIPIKIELTPIVNLFNAEALDERYNVSSSKILDWFLPLYLKYCKVLKYDCYSKRGCGYDDECDLEETCVKESYTPRGYRCLVLSWADVPNWPQMPTKVDLNVDNDPTSRSDTVAYDALVDPEPANVTWFRSRDLDNTGALSLQELIVDHHVNHWFNHRYRTAMDRLLSEADLNQDRVMDMPEYLKLHQRHPWYAEQVSFVLVNTDNNKYLTKEELMEASKVSEDISILNFSPRQLENLVDGLMGIGDKNGDKKITFDEYVHMSHDVFVNNFAPKNLKRVMRL